MNPIAFTFSCWLLAQVDVVVADAGCWKYYIGTIEPPSFRTQRTGK